MTQLADFLDQYNTISLNDIIALIKKYICAAALPIEIDNKIAYYKLSENIKMQFKIEDEKDNINIKLLYFFNKANTPLKFHKSNNDNTITLLDFNYQNIILDENINAQLDFLLSLIIMNNSFDQMLFDKYCLGCLLFISSNPSKEYSVDIHVETLTEINFHKQKSISILSVLNDEYNKTSTDIFITIDPDLYNFYVVDPYFKDFSITFYPSGIESLTKENIFPWMNVNEFANFIEYTKKQYYKSSSTLTKIVYFVKKLFKRK